jgi:hypothetical protein
MRAFPFSLFCVVLLGLLLFGCPAVAQIEVISNQPVMVPIENQPQGAGPRLSQDPGEAELRGRRSQAELGNEESGRGLSGYWQEVRSAPAAIEQSARNAAKVSFPAGGGSSYSGSGVYLGDVYFATAYHVPRGTSGRGYVMFRDGERINCEVIDTDKTWDLALCKLEREHPNLSGVEVASDNPSIGETLYSVGFGRGFRIFGGALRRWAQPGGQRHSDWVEHDSGAISGDSGGPIFNEAGKLVGCLWGSSGATTMGTGTGRFRLFIKPLFPRLAQWRANRIGRQIAGIGVQCPPGGQCPPGYGAGYSPPASSGGAGVSPGGTPTPVEPQPQAPTQPPPQATVPGIDYDALAAALVPKIAEDDRFRGPQGPPGPAGPRGPPGEDGADGADGEVSEAHLQAITKTLLAAIREDERFRGAKGERGPRGEPGDIAEIDIDKLAANVLGKIPDTRVMLVDGGSGQVLDDESYAPGEPIVLDFQNIIRSAKARAARD